MNDYDDALSYLCATNELDNYNCPFKISYIKPLSVKNEIIIKNNIELEICKRVTNDQKRVIKKLVFI